MRLLPAYVGGFLVIMDATIVAVALPSTGAALGIDAAALPWVVNSYTLPFAGFLLLGGRLADVLGPRAALLAGLLTFAAATTAGGLAGSAPMLFAARAAQGIGGAVLLPATLAVIATVHPAGPARTRALAAWSAVGAVGATAGTVLGGVLTEWAGWRWVLLVAVPPALAAAAMTVRTVPAHRPGASRPRLDLTGAALVTAGLTAVVLALTMSAVSTLMAGLLLLAGFVARQRRAPDPLLPPSTWRLPGVARGNVVMFTVGLAFFATPVLLALHLQRDSGWSALAAGLAFVPVALALVAGGRLAAWTTVRWGPRRAAATGLAVAAAGYVGLALDAGGYATSVGGPGVLVGLGIGAAFTPITVVATAAVPQAAAGLAGGVLTTTRQLSAAVGLAGLSAVVLAAGEQAAMVVACACCATAAVLAFLLPRTGSPPDQAGPSAPGTASPDS
ncbi:MAG: hypothetical protein ABS81_07605 [Pseudonocardia sp. SCN 72-86]|nr:MAG: hypothetical protein ABS81_07605 [Pseudonocardia sp. SCN 72-86]